MANKMVSGHGFKTSRSLVPRPISAVLPIEGERGPLKLAEMGLETRLDLTVTTRSGLGW